MKIFLIIYGIIAVLWFSINWGIVRVLYNRGSLGKVSKWWFVRLTIADIFCAIFFPIPIISVVISRLVRDCADAMEDDVREYVKSKEF